MREITKFKGLKPAGAEGRVCIDLKDPDTKKVKERIQGKNHVFEESLMSGSGMNWITAISNAYLVLNSTDKVIDPTIPYLFGQTAGYGQASLPGSGLYRGAYNKANQILEQISLDSVLWRFQYDFTTSQANDIPINVVGLTHQYGNYAKNMLQGFRVPSTLPSSCRITNDGRYVYSCSSSGIVSKLDLYTGIQQNIDISNDIGNNTSDNKTIGYSPKNGRYYVHVHSSTAARRKFYEYSNSTFNNLLNVYDISNVNTSSGTLPVYIYNNKAYVLTNSSNIIRAFDYVNNEPEYIISLPVENSNTMPQNANTINTTPYDCPCPISSEYIKCGSNSIGIKGIIFNLLTENSDAFLTNPGSNYVLYKYPLSEEKIICNSNGNTCNTAISAYQLNTPFTKTSANAMTVTYELEVFW